MAALAILEYPDPRLRQRAEPVDAFDASLAGLVDDMFETLYAARGIGLAATQVDVHRRVVTIDLSGKGDAPEVFINPQILSRRRPGKVEESCLSVPGVSDLVRRSTVLRVRYQGLDGRSAEREVHDMLAVCLAHEIDHLDGRLFVDRLSIFTRLRLRLRFAISRPSLRTPMPARNGAASHA